MPYAVYKRKGGIPFIDKYVVDGLPELPNSVAVKITPEQELIAKHLHQVITFDEVEELMKEREEKEKLNKEKETLKKQETKIIKKKLEI